MNRAKGDLLKTSGVKPLSPRPAVKPQSASSHFAQPKLPPVAGSMKHRFLPNAPTSAPGLQRKTIGIPPTYPPVYRPQTQQKELQRKTGAPAVYRPNPSGLRSAMEKTVFGQNPRVAQPAMRSSAPAVYKPAPTTMAAPARPTLAHEVKLPVQRQLRPTVAPAQRRQPVVSAISGNSLQRQIPGNSRVIQRLGTNISFVAEEDRYFETPDQKARLRVDPENDAYLEHHFNELTSVSLTTASLAQKIVFILRSYADVPYDAQKKHAALGSQVQQIVSSSGSTIDQRVLNVGTMFHAAAVTCWEKAALCHLSLAEIGIGSVLRGGNDKNTGVGHAWLLLDINCVVDPTLGRIFTTKHYESGYTITSPGKRVANPKIAVDKNRQANALMEADTIIEAMIANTLSSDQVSQFNQLKLQVAAARQQKQEQAEFELEQRKRVGPMVSTPEGNIKRRDASVPSPVTIHPGSLYEPGGQFKL